MKIGIHKFRLLVMRVQLFGSSNLVLFGIPAN